MLKVDSFVSLGNYLVVEPYEIEFKEDEKPLVLRPDKQKKENPYRVMTLVKDMFVDGSHGPYAAGEQILVESHMVQKVVLPEGSKIYIVPKSAVVGVFSK